MKNKLKLIAVITIIALLTPSLLCAKTTSDLKTLVESNNAFGFDLYQELKAKDGNLFFSPYSISTALAMTYAGACGETEKEMAQVLHFSLAQQPLHSSFSKLQSEFNDIQNKGHIQLSIANALWAQRDYHFLESFLKLNKEYYGAGLNLVDFARETETARKAINLWVENKTQQKIKDLIKSGSLDSLTRLVLSNAIYFKGDWSSQFDKKRTVDADFHITPDKTVKTSMMSQKSEFRLKDFGSFSAIELPYEGDDLSMIIFLPKSIDGLAGLEAQLTSVNVEKWLNELGSVRKREVSISIPKFKTTSEFELSDILGAMGMQDAFSERLADFSGMTGKKDLFISKVIHKAFVDVNEEGTEAAAATAVVVTLKAISRPLTFQADHPFIFLIRANKTGSILFIGRIVDPR